MKRLCSTLSVFLIFAPLSTVLAKVPETAKIVFTSNREGNSEIYIMNPDGSDQINLTQHRANDVSPVWSPTGEQILFTSDRGGIEDLYLMDADGTNVRQVFKKLIGREFPTWSPDGKTLAYHRFDTLSIYIASSDGEDEEELTDGLFPAWSPNGSEIAFVGGRFALIDGRPVAANPKIQIINLQTHEEEKLLPGQISMFNPDWAPDSTQIAFSGMILADKKVGPTIDIYVVNRDGTGLKEIAAGGVGRTPYTTWSPHGNELIYNKRVGDTSQLFKVALNGGVPEQLTHRGGSSKADWFDPAFALPVSPQPFLLTNTWAELKTQD